jgi:glycosyltransferase involved in cell wall biosynthesis
MTARSRPLSILHVVAAVGPTNGQYNEHCLPLAHARRIAICSVTPATVTPPPEIALFEGDGTARGFARALRRAFAAADYDVVHAHAAVAGAGLLAANVLARRSMSNTVYTVQNCYRNYKLRNRVLLYLMFAAFARVVFCSNAVERSMPWTLRRLSRRKAAVVENAVDLARARRVASAAAHDGAGFTAVSVGRLIEIKNGRTLLEAFDRSRRDDSRLVFVGDGALRGALRTEADRRALDGQVVFTGLVERDDVYRHLAAADVVVSASRGEGLPVAVLEAMACGRPVILSDIPPHREIAGGASFIGLVAPDDAEGFAGELRRFMDMSEEDRAELGERCRRLVEERFGLDAMHRSYVPIYAALLGRRARDDGVAVAVPALGGRESDPSLTPRAKEERDERTS